MLRSEPFPEIEARMAWRVVLNDRLLLVPQPFVKGRRLKTVRCQKHSRAPNRLRILFSSFDERSAHAASPFSFIDPQIGDVTAAAPRVSADTRCDAAGVITLHGREGSSVEVSRGLGIKLINSIDQESLQFKALGFVSELDYLRLHGI